MNSESNWLTELMDTWSDVLRSGAEHLPAVAGAILVFFVGWIVAHGVRRAVRAAANASNRFLGRSLDSGTFASVQVSPAMITLLAEVCFWVVAVLAATLALRIAGFGVISQWLDRAAAYLPNLIAAAVILIVGFLLSVFVREQLSATVKDPRASARPAWLITVVQVVIVIAAMIVALDQLGIDVALLIALAVVATAGVTFTLGATFAMGARQYAANLVGIRSARGQLSIGQWLRVDGIEGQIVELSATQIILDTEQGRVLLPGYVMETKVATILPRASGEAS